MADEVIVLEAQEALLAVGQFYWDFPQTSDEEVTRLLSSLTRAPVPLSTVGGDPVRACEIELETARLAGDWRRRPIRSGSWYSRTAAAAAASARGTERSRWR